MVTNEGFVLDTPIWYEDGLWIYLCVLCKMLLLSQQLQKKVTMRIFETIPEKRGVYTVCSQINSCS
jgi:hypothetical protein